jgi:hypothetical protein
MNEISHQLNGFEIAQRRNLQVSSNKAFNINWSIYIFFDRGVFEKFILHNQDHDSPALVLYVCRVTGFG